MGNEGPSLKPVSFENADIFRTSFPQKFKPRQGEAYRMFLPEIDCSFMARVHYLKPNYTFCLAQNGMGKACPACDAGLYASFRYGMNVVVYKTDANGELRPVKKEIAGKNVEAYDWEVKLWLFAQTPANQLHTVRSTWKLMDHDVRLACISEKPQKYDINPYPDSVFQSRPDLQPLIIKSLKEDRRDPAKELGIYQDAAAIHSQLGPALAEEAQKKAARQNKQGGSWGQQPQGAYQPAPVQGAFPQAPLREAAFNSPSVIAPVAGYSAADAKLASEVVGPARTETVRDISEDGEFAALLNNIKNKKA